MRLRATLVLALLAVVAAGAYYVVEVRGAGAREAARLAEQRLVDFDPAAVRELVVDKPGERVVVRRDGDGWRIAAPAGAAADASTVEGLLAFVRRLEKVRALDGAADLAAYGLVEPRVRLTLTRVHGPPLTLTLGSLAPTGTGVYARLDDAPLVFLAPSELTAELMKSPYVEQLRDRRLLPLDTARVRRLEIERAGVRIAAERVGDHAWRVERPFTGSGDDGIIHDLLWKLASARSRGPADATDARTALARPHARARVIDDSGRAAAVTVVLDEARQLLYAAVDGAPAVHIIERQLLADLAIDPDALRDRQLLPHDRRDVERITVRYPDTALVLERAAAGWRVTAPVQGEAAHLVVDNLLEILPNLRYLGLEAQPGDLGRYGLDRPRLTVTVGLTGGRTLPAVTVGDERDGEQFVMVAGKPAVYKVDSRLLRVIPEDPTDAKRYPLPEQLQRAAERQRKQL